MAFLSNSKLRKKKGTYKKATSNKFQEVSRTLQVPTLFFGACSNSRIKKLLQEP